MEKQETNYRDADDHRLMELTARGFEDAFQEIYRRHRERLFNFAWKYTNNKRVAADAVQKTFEYLLNIRDRYEPDAKLKNLLYKVTRNNCLKLLDKKRKEKNVDRYVLDHQESREKTHPEKRAVQDEHVREIQECIRDLPEKHRDVVILRVSEECEYREIADILDIPIGTVKSRLYKGMNMLRKSVRDRFDLKEDSHEL